MRCFLMFSVVRLTMFSKIGDFTFVNAFLDAAENGRKSFRRIYRSVRSTRMQMDSCERLHVGHFGNCEVRFTTRKYDFGE